MGIQKYSTPINFIVFQICWFACVLGAVDNLEWLGPLLVLVTVPLQVYLLTEQYKAEAVFVIVCGVAGFFLETIFILGKVYAPIEQAGLEICPPWMAALWFNFAMLVSISLRWLKGRYILAGILGGLAGPVAYWGGEKLGALKISAPFIAGYVPLAAAWAVVLPLFVYLHSGLIDKKDTSSNF